MTFIEHYTQLKNIYSSIPAHFWIIYGLKKKKTQMKLENTLTQLKIKIQYTKTCGILLKQYCEKKLYF